MMLKEIEIKSVPWVCLNSGYCYLLDVVKKSVPDCWLYIFTTRMERVKERNKWFMDIAE